MRSTSIRFSESFARIPTIRSEIRRMAYYHAYHNQPIPFDIALLAQVCGVFRDGLLRVTIPPTSDREPQTKLEQDHAWTHRSTGEVVDRVVGGLWPWLRQGWAFL